MSLVHEMIELDERVIVFELTLTDDSAKELLTNLVELLSPLIDQRDEDYEMNNSMDHSCGIVESQFPKLDIGYIITASSGNIPKFLRHVQCLPECQSSSLLLFFLAIKD